VFDLIRHKRNGEAAVLAFDRARWRGSTPLVVEYRKRKLAKLVRRPQLGFVLNEHYEGDGEVIFKQACKLSCEGIVSKPTTAILRQSGASCSNVARWLAPYRTLKPD
jgi:ATP-dependent DNA ligase